MRQIIDTLAQLQRLRDKSVKDKTVELAKQKQICAGYDNNIKALGYLVEKTSAGAAVYLVGSEMCIRDRGNRLAGAGKNAGQYQSHANAEKPHGGGVRRESSRPDAGRQTPRATRKRHGESAKSGGRHRRAVLAAAQISGVAMKTVITFGTFDVFHVGHLRLLQRARALGERLLVGVSSDALNIAKKGRAPVYHQDDRMAIIAGLACVDGVFLEESLEQKAEYLRGYSADILVMGDDWAGKFDSFAYICEVVYFPRTPSVSTTGIIEVIRGLL